MLEHLFQQTIILEKRIGKNEYGKASYASPVDIPVRYEGTNKLIRLDNGEKVESQYAIFTSEEMNIGDRLTIEGKKLIVLEVTATHDPNDVNEILFREVYT